MSSPDLQKGEKLLFFSSTFMWNRLVLQHLCVDQSHPCLQAADFVKRTLYFCCLLFISWNNDFAHSKAVLGSEPGPRTYFDSYIRSLTDSQICWSVWTSCIGYPCLICSCRDTTPDCEMIRNWRLINCSQRNFHTLSQLTATQRRVHSSHWYVLTEVETRSYSLLYMYE